LSPIVETSPPTASPDFGQGHDFTDFVSAQVVVFEWLATAAGGPAEDF
jgi:hypothetical protein